MYNNNILVIMVFLLSGCGGPVRVDVARFNAEYAQVNVAHSMKSVKYIGINKGNAYLKISTILLINKSWSDEVIFVPLLELDAKTLGNLGQGVDK